MYNLGAGLFRKILFRDLTYFGDFILVIIKYLFTDLKLNIID